MTFPDTVGPIEVGWTLVAAASAAAGVLVYRDLCRQLREVRARPGVKPYVVRSFEDDVANVRGRLIASLFAILVGGLSMTERQPPIASIDVTGWTIIVGLFALPGYLLWRNLAEEARRRRTLHELAREARAGRGGAADPPEEGTKP